MTEISLDRVFSILAAASSDKPWITARGIARRLGDRVDGVQIEQLLLSYCRDCEDKGLAPTVRYSSLPSRKTLEVLWGTIEKVGSRRLENITKNDLADDSLGDFEELAQADVFLSHSHRDYEAMMAVGTLMLQHGVIPWLAETHIQQGEHVHDEIIRALDVSQTFLLFLSPHALDSRWTGKEYMNARSRGIPIFVVANIDFDEITQILESMHGKKPRNRRFPGKFKAGARAFVENLISDEDHIVRTFAYSQIPISASQITQLHPVRPVSELPAAIRLQRTDRAGVRER